jgi:DNA repair photolyase
MTVVYETTGRMYENVRTWNPFVGCHFDCVYCFPSFRRQAKRLRWLCEKCYRYEPHFHPERLKRIPNAKTIFACAYGDIAFARMEWLLKVLDVIRKHQSRTFYMQTKDPRVFIKLERETELPRNLILGITLETDDDTVYDRISKAPKPSERVKVFSKVEHSRKFVTVEPILEFNDGMLEAVRAIDPEFVYVGYESHGMRSLPEPPLEKTMKLIESLRDYGYDVRLKIVGERDGRWLLN